jgi:hypothetical protein
VLKETLANGRITVVGVANGQAAIALAVPGLSDVIADKEPAFTPAGRPTLRKRSKTQMNRLYLAAIASEVLRIARQAFATAPALPSIRCLVARDNELGGDEPIYAGTITRTLGADPNSNTDNPESLAAILETAEDVYLNKRGRTGEVCPLETDRDQALAGSAPHLNAATRVVTPQDVADAHKSVMPKLPSRVSSTRASFAGTASSGPDNRGADLSAVAPEKRPPQDPRASSGSWGSWLVIPMRICGMRRSTRCGTTRALSFATLSSPR